MLENTSSWYSATRLPKTWQETIKGITAKEIKNLFDSAPRGETIKRKLSPKTIKSLQDKGITIPSFGGNWSQEYHIETEWEPVTKKPNSSPPSPDKKLKIGPLLSHN